MNNVIETSGLTKSYRGVKAVDDLTMSISDGQVHGLLGPNGSGKSTTMKMLLGLVRPTGGEVVLFGERMTRSSRPRLMAKVGSLIEQPSAYPHLTGAENIAVAARLVRADEAQAERAVQLVRLQKQMGKLVKHYSLGMKQRLGLAMALLRDPQLLILDEPTNGLDPAGIEEIRDLIVHLAHEEGRTVLVSSHLLSEIEKMADELTVIHQGSLLFQGTQRRLFQTQPPRVFVQTPLPEQAAAAAAELRPTVVDGGVEIPDLSEDDVARLIARLVAADVPVHQVVRRHRSLEEIFLGLTGREQLQ